MWEQWSTIHKLRITQHIPFCKKHILLIPTNTITPTNRYHAEKKERKGNETGFELEPRYRKKKVRTSSDITHGPFSSE